MARLHPSFKGIPGAPATGAALVSFNERAFESQGHKQGENAPVSETAAFKYGTALKFLLSHGSERYTRVRKATVVHWADGNAAPAAARAAEHMTRRLLDPPASDNDEVEKTREIIRKLLENRDLRNPPTGYDTSTPVHVLVLYGNRGRLGSSLVSFNERAFESQGHKQGENAPVSETAAFKYGTALKFLLSHGSERYTRVRKATVVHWADGNAAPAAARAAEHMTRRLLDPPASDNDEVEKTREIIRAA